MKNNDKYSAYWQVIAENTGYDFSGYSSESLNHRLEKFISFECIGSADELRDKLYSDRIAQEKILGRLLTTYTEMFRDPDFFLSLRNNALPYLSTYPKIKIWHVGCASGEEVYSLAILLEELNLLDRCEIYATDVNRVKLKTAETGIFPLQVMQQSSERYYRAGGKINLSHYYTAFYDHIIFNSRLRNKIKFLQHDMIEDTSFDKFHLILCRNVFIYFNQNFQQRIAKVLCENMLNFSYLGIGMLENFIECDNSCLAPIDKMHKIYRKVKL